MCGPFLIKKINILAIKCFKITLAFKKQKAPIYVPLLFLQKISQLFCTIMLKGAKTFAKIKVHIKDIIFQIVFD